MEVTPCVPVARGDFAAFDTTALHVVPDTAGVAEAFAQHCAARGLPAPTLGAVVPENASRVLLLSALSPAVTSAEATDRVMESFRVLRALGATHRTRRVEVFVAQDLGGDFGFASDPGVRAALGAAAGLAKSAAREWPQARIRVIDLPADASPDELAMRLGEELTTTSDELEIGLSAHGRVTPRMREVATRVKPTHPSQPGDVWLVSGGARGVTATCVQALARRAPLRFALLGRTPIDEPEPAAVRGCTTDAELKRALLAAAHARGEKPTPAQLQRQASAIVAAREARASCDALCALGAEVRYFAADIARADAVENVVRQVRAEWGPIRGLVHAAGVLADKALHEKTDEQFLSVYRTKVHGFHALLAATRDEPLAAIGVFSSVAGRMGNAGQADYAAANETLNKLCQVEQHRRGATCLVRAINWGPWDGGMVSSGLKAHFAAKGIALIPLHAGAEIFAELMTGALPTTVECVVGANLNSAHAQP